MFQATLNINIIEQRLDKTVKAVERMTGAPDEAKYWPEIRDRLRKMLISNLQDIHQVPIKDSTREAKKRAAEKGVTVQRISGGSKVPIRYPNVNWKSTGTLEDVYTEQFMTAPIKVRKMEDEIVFTIGLDTSMFVHDEKTGLPYPEKVDQELRDRTGGAVSLVSLTPQQQSEIIEMLIKKNESLTERIFGRISGAIGRFLRR